MKPRTAIAIVAALGACAATGAATAADMAYITTPTRNIGCVAGKYGGWTLRCDIRTHTYPTPARPRSCDLDYGDSMTLHRMWRARWTCHGDTALPPPNGKGYRTLAYGTTWKWGPFQCRSQASGLSCMAWSGYGFFMSKQRTGPTYQQ